MLKFLQNYLIADLIRKYINQLFSSNGHVKRVIRINKKQIMSGRTYSIRESHADKTVVIDIAKNANADYSDNFLSTIKYLGNLIYVIICQLFCNFILDLRNKFDFSQFKSCKAALLISKLIEFLC